MSSQTFRVSEVPIATEPFVEISYHQAIKELLGLPVFDKEQTLEMLLTDIDDLEIEFRLPSRIDELLAESKQKLAVAAANESTALDDQAREAVRKKKQMFQKQIDNYAGILAEEDQHFAEYKTARKQTLDQELARIEAGDFPTDVVEACPRYHGRLVRSEAHHPVLGALQLAFHCHHPLTLSPDMIWLLICQGVAQQINIHTESLRSKFVQHAGKIKVSVRRDDFFKGSPENPWGEMIDELCQQVRNEIGPVLDLFVPQFSTTGPTERIVGEIVLLDAMQRYIEYEFRSLCGIPAITLQGTVEDWQSLADRAEAFAEFDLEWWLTPLRPILQELVATAKGAFQRDFWESIYKYESVSGGDVITGWIVAFFPYLNDNQGNPTVKNIWLANGGRRLRSLLAGAVRGRQLWRSPKLREFPSSLARAPFTWDYRDQRFDMELLGGFVGVAQDETTLTLRPEIGWAIRQVNVK